jgi:two-component system, OmpR family, copper resistance phosphate regulon response regulator CusR
MTMRILIIEDEPKVAAAVAEGFRAEGFDVSSCASGEDGFFLLSTQRFDLLILDILLPGRNGLEILEAARRLGARLPVLVLTARDSVEDRVRGLDCGADDYVVKPFAFSELLARARALLRRGPIEQIANLKYADIEMDCQRRSCRRQGRELSLTAKEYDLLEYLLRHNETVVSREMLATDVWRATERATPLDNVIDVHVARLRRKLDEPCEKKLLKTIRGVGFMLGE